MLNRTERTFLLMAEADGALSPEQTSAVEDALRSSKEKGDARELDDIIAELGFLSPDVLEELLLKAKGQAEQTETHELVATGGEAAQTKAPKPPPKSEALEPVDKPSSKPAPAKAKRMLGSYELIEKLGEGMMGMVFKAKDADGNIVAIKTMKAELANTETFIKRFRREAQVMKSFDHDYLVKGIEYGEANGLHFCALEFIEGETLQAKLKRGETLDESQALYVAQCLGKALEYAWEKTIVHRDIKPGNIMIQTDGRIRLMDMGLAKDVSDTEATVTQAGGILGSPAYAAPEQLEGKVDVDVRADLYALGTTLFHLTCGRPPFLGPSAGVVASNNLTEPLPDPKELKSELSGPFCELLKALTEKKPEDRIQNPTQLLEAIGKVQKGESVATKQKPKAIAGTTSRSRAKAHSTREKSGVPVLPIAAAIILLIGGGAFYLFKQKEPGPMRLANASKTGSQKTKKKFLKTKLQTPEKGRKSDGRQGAGTPRADGHQGTGVPGNELKLGKQGTDSTKDKTGDSQSGQAANQDSSSQTKVVEPTPIVAQPSAPDVPIELDLKLMGMMEAEPLQGGGYRIKTTGGDPRVNARPRGKYDPDQQFILAFDYISDTGLNLFEIFYGPPIQGGQSTIGPRVAPSGKWKSYALNIKARSPRIWRGEYTIFRLDFGTQGGRTIQIRNLRLRAPNARERQLADDVVAALATPAEKFDLCEIRITSDTQVSVEKLALHAPRLSGQPGVRFESIAPKLKGADFIQVPWKSVPEYRIEVTRTGYLYFIKIKNEKLGELAPQLENAGIDLAGNLMTASRAKVQEGTVLELSDLEASLAAGKIVLQEADPAAVANKEPQWTTLIPELITRTRGSTYSLLSDHSVLMSHAIHSTEVCVVQTSCPLKKVTALRIEILPDPVWGGRLSPDPAGNFALTELELFLPGWVGRIDRHAAKASHPQGGEPVSRIIDGNHRSPWGAHNKGREAQTAMILFNNPLKGIKDRQMLIRVRQQFLDAARLIGRFRLSVTDNGSPKLTAPTIALPAAPLPVHVPKLLGNALAGEGQMDSQPGILNVYAGSPMPAPGMLSRVLVNTSGLNGEFGVHILRPAGRRHQLIHSQIFETKEKGIVSFRFPDPVYVEKGDLLAHHGQFGPTYVVDKEGKDLTFSGINAEALTLGQKLDLRKGKRAKQKRSYLLSAHFVPDPLHLPEYRSKGDQSDQDRQTKSWNSYLKNMRSRNFDAAAKEIEGITKDAELRQYLNADIKHMRAFSKRVEEGMSKMIGQTIRVKGIAMKIEGMKNGRFQLKGGAIQMDAGSEALGQKKVAELGLPKDQTRTHVTALYDYLFRPSQAMPAIDAAIAEGSHMKFYRDQIKPRLFVTCATAGAKAQIEYKFLNKWVTLKAQSMPRGDRPVECELREKLSYRVTLTKAGYYSEQVQIDVNRKGHFIHKFTLKKSPLPAGVVPAKGAKDKFGNPIRKDGYKTLPAEVVHLKTGMHLVLIRPGEFIMGSDDDPPKRKVKISRPFYIGKYETTRSEWVQFLPELHEPHWPKLPATRVNWHQIQKLVALMNKGLGVSIKLGRFAHITEAQWEYACRAGSNSKYSFGDDEKKLGQYAWFKRNRGASPLHTVGKKKPNVWGVYDMHGNAFELVYDGWTDNPSSKPQTDPKGPENPVHCIARGLGSDREANELKCSSRMKWNKEGIQPIVGFRLVLDL